MILYFNQLVDIFSKLILLINEIVIVYLIPFLAENYL